MTDSISRRLRFEILRRDNHTCRYCGRTAPEVKLTVDHVVPVALGGGDDPTNLATACADCNSGKSSISPTAEHVAQVADDAARYAAALAEATEARRRDIQDMSARVDWFDEAWRAWTWTDTAGEKHVLDRDPDWASTIERFFVLGLDRDELQHALRTAMTTPAVRDTWRYFCGIAWGEINTRQEMARQALRADATATDGADESPDYARGYDDGFHDARGDFVDVPERIAAAYERGLRAGIARAVDGTTIPTDPEE